MTKNDIVGWIVLIVIAFFVICGIGAALESSSSTTVTCNGSAYSVTCTRS